MKHLIKKETMKTKAILLLLLLPLLWSCSKDNEAPRIDSVWYNMVERPIEQAPCAYPGQTICVHGANFYELRRIIVNGVDINVTNILVMQTENYLTFQLPSTVSTTGDNIRVTTAYGKADYHFVIRPTAEQPVITSFSATTLVSGATLIIKGTNLTGATEVWLPLTFGGRVKCEFDATKTNSDTELYVMVPADVTFATGRCEVVMEKTDAGRQLTYTEKVYSDKTDFKN